MLYVHIMNLYMLTLLFNVYSVVIMPLSHYLQFNRGRHVPTRWVFGLLCKNYTPPRPIFQVVENSSARTLIPIIRQYIVPGSTVNSDAWRAYSSLGQWYTHNIVNHSQGFVNAQGILFISHCTSKAQDCLRSLICYLF